MSPGARASRPRPETTTPAGGLRAAEGPGSAVPPLLQAADRGDEAGATRGLAGVAEVVPGAALVNLRIEGILGLGSSFGLEEALEGRLQAGPHPKEPHEQKEPASPKGPVA